MKKLNTIILISEENDEQGNLLLGTLYGIRAMADVAADSESVVTTDGTLRQIS